VLRDSITTEQVTTVLTSAPKILQDAANYTLQVAAIAPQVAPVLRKVQPLLSVGPVLAPLAEAISSDVASVLRAAPQYAPILNQAIEVLVKAPHLAPQIASTLKSLAETSQSIGADPDLPLFLERLNVLIRAVGGSSPLSGMGSPALGAVRLRSIIPWIDRSIFVANNRWLLWAAPLALFTFGGVIGFAVGRGKRES
jgi:hypothetical protein